MTDFFQVLKRRSTLYFSASFFPSFFFYFCSYPLPLSTASFICNFGILNFGISLYMLVTAQKAFHLFKILPRHFFQLCLLWKLPLAIITPPFSPFTGFAFSLWFVCYCSAMDHAFFCNYYISGICTRTFSEISSRR